MPSHRYSTALSHLVLAGTSLTCLVWSYNHNQQWNFGHASFIVLSVNSILGLWRWGNPDYGSNIDGLCRFTTHLELITVLPFITTQLYYDYDYQNDLIYAHALCALLPLVMYLLDATNDDVNEAIMVTYGVSLGTVSILEENNWGVAAAISYAIAYFYTLRSQDCFEMPSMDFFNYAMCFFAYFAYRALLE